MAWAPIVLTAVSALSSAGAAKQQADAQASADRYNAQVNAQDVQIYLNEGQQQAIQDERTTAINQGQIRAATGASGMTASGSALDVLADATQQGELQKQYDVYQAKVKSMGYQSSANLDTAGAANTQTAGSMMASNALLKGASTGLEQANRLGLVKLG